MAASLAPTPWNLPRPIAEAVSDLLLNHKLALTVTDPHLPDNPIVHASPGFTALTGYAGDEVLGRNCRFLQGSATDVAELDRLRTALRQGEAVSVDLVNYRKNGEPFGNRLQVDPIAIDGRLRYFLGRQQEIPLPAVDPEGRDIVLRDLRHRVNGAMQLAMSLLRLRMARIKEPAAVEALGDALEQLDTVMLVQRQLDGLGRDNTADAGPALAELAEALVGGFGGKVAVELDCASLLLPPNRLEPLLMLANEALINALRHAYPGERGGVIRVALAPSGGGGFEMVVADDGVGAPAGSLERGSLGTMLMRSFARQLGGTLELAGGSGVRLCLRVPPRG